MESEGQQDALRRQNETIERLRNALEEKQLVIVVGAGVTLHATSLASGTPLSRLTWTGLIRNGLDYLVHEGLVEASSRRTQQAYSLLEDNTPGSSLDAASFITGQLRLNGRFSTWLDFVFGNLDREIRHPAILEALRDLFQKGAMLLTTNYDDLLERVCQSRHIGRSDQDELLRFQRGEVKGILHIHGSHHNPNEVVLDGSGYDAITHSDATQNILRTFLQLKTLLFVGCGSGLDDPNFGALLSWAFDRQQNIPNRHCLLIRDGDNLNHKLLVRLKYGSSYEDLAPFLSSLLPQPNPHLTQKALDTDFAVTSSVPQVLNVGLEQRPVLATDQRRDYLAFLRFSQMDARHVNIKNALAKTCTWLLSKSEYLDWLDIDKVQEHHGFLWIKGKPAAGKSTIAKFALAHAEKSMPHSIIISFFFNARGENLEKSTLGMYRSLLWQLLDKVPRLQTVLDSLEPMPENVNECRPWDLQLLEELFRRACENLGQQHLTCFIDALDECEEDQIRDMVAFFESIGQSAVSSPSRFLVCFSSRHYPHITINKSVQLVLEGQEGHREDIAKYLHSELKAGRSKLIEQIKSEIVERASGIFLWVVLVVQMLNKEYDRGRIHAIRQRLDEIPNGLDDLFNDILIRDGQNMRELILCLRWILYTKRPLKCEELYYAMLVSLEPQHVNEWKPDEITKQDMERYVLHCSKGLAEVTKSRHQTVQFIHESVRDFLLNGRGLDKLQPGLSNNFSGLSHDELKRSCQKYMEIITSASALSTSTATSTVVSSNATDPHQIKLDKFPFLEYAVHGVLHHADVAQQYGVEQDDFVQRFPLGRWIMFSNAFERYKIRLYTQTASLLYILAKENFPNLIRIELRQIENMDISGERYGYPILAALTSSNEAAAIALLMPSDRPLLNNNNNNNNNNSQARISHPRNADDQQAVGRVVKGLLGLTYPKGRTLLSIAEERNDVDLVNTLLNTQKVDVDSEDSISHLTPLAWAAERGHDTVMKLLLNARAVDPTEKDSHGRTPLSCAVKGGHEIAVKLLLNSSTVDPNVKDVFGRTPLMQAVIYGRDSVVKLLLNTATVDLDTKDPNGRTPLSWAAECGHNTKVQLLLSARTVDPNTKDNKGHTPLSWAAASGDETTVQLLLSTATVNPDEKDNNGYTPLVWALIRREKAMVKLFLNSETINLNAKDNDGRSLLWFAAATKAEETVKTLLARPAVDPDVKDRYGHNPLWAAAERGAIEVVKILSTVSSLDAGATDIGGRTLLSRLTEQLLFSGVRSFSSANSALEDYQFQLMLLERRKMGQPRFDRPTAYLPFDLEVSSVIRSQEAIAEMVKLLLTIGAVDPNAKDIDGRTPLQIAEERQATEIIKILLAAGSVSTGPTDKHEDTPLDTSAQQVPKGPSPFLQCYALPDYQIQLMLLEQQNKRRRLMAEAE